MIPVRKLKLFGGPIDGYPMLNKGPVPECIIYRSGWPDDDHGFRVVCKADPPPILMPHDRLWVAYGPWPHGPHYRRQGKSLRYVWSQA